MESIFRANRLACSALVIGCLLAPAASATVLFETSFNAVTDDLDTNGQPDGWTVRDGAIGSPGWRIAPDGEYRYDDTGHGRSEYTDALPGGANDTVNYVISTDFRKSTNLTGLVARSNGAGDFYHARVNGANALEIYRFVSGGATLVASTTLDDTYDTGETWRIEFSAMGRRTAAQVTAKVYNQNGHFVGATRYTDTTGTFQNSGFTGVRGASPSAFESFSIATPLTITTAQGAGADAYVEFRSDQPNNANTNYGWGNLAIKAADQPGGNSLFRKSYLRFDLSSVDQPIYSAAVDLQAISGDGSGTLFQVYGLLDNHAGDLSGGWIETGAGSITWNNAPANAAGNDLSGSEVVFLGEVFGENPGSSLNLASFTSDALVNFLNADTNELVTLVVVAKEVTDNFTSTPYSFTGGEATSGILPSLRLVTIPEPVSLAALAVGMLGIMRRR